MRKTHQGFLFLVIFGLLLPATVLSEPAKINWKRVGDDLEAGQASVSRFMLFSSSLAFYRSALRRFRVGVIQASDYGRKTASVQQLCKLSRAVACINANFFDEQDKPLGLVVSRGNLHNRMHRGGKTLTGVFQVTRKGIEIRNRAKLESSAALEAVQAGPRLFADGKPIEGLREANAASRRSGVCIDNKQRLVFYVVSSGFFGVSLADLQQILRSPSVGCVDALNLDGGGSSQFYFSGKVSGAAAQSREVFIEGSDQVPVALGLFQK